MPQPPRNCGCPEGWLRFVNGYGRETGEVIPLPQRHDCRYVSNRNALIPLAQQVADMSADYGEDAWDVAFLVAMQELANRARAAGLL